MSTSTMNQVQLESEFKIFWEDKHTLVYSNNRYCPPSCNLRTSSHRDIRSIINSNLATSLKEVISLWDRARLNTIATTHAGAWLQALPNSSLGLAMSPHEFVIANTDFARNPSISVPTIVIEVCLWSSS